MLRSSLTASADDDDSSVDEFPLHAANGRCRGSCLLCLAMGALGVALGLLLLAHHAPGFRGHRHSSEDTAACPASFPSASLRLPDALRPTHYDVSLHPNATTLSFTGNVSVSLRVLTDTSYIVLHARELNVSGAKLLGAPSYTLSNALHCEAWDQLAFRVRPSLTAGTNVTLRLGFAGAIQRDFKGLYLSSRSGGGTADERRTLVTQFEATDAREAFPCWDEPAFKAVFRLSIVREPGQQVLANAPIRRSVKLAKGLVREEMEETEVMSTYLVAYAVLKDFASQSGKAEGTAAKTEVAVWAPAESVEATAFALDIARRALGWLEGFFRQPFPLKKMDLLAVSDFAAGAMENWGLVTFRDHMVLCPNGTTPLRSVELVAMVVVHELAHQWFGNLVTMRWWGDLWLNEGFASYLEYLGTAALQPHWRLMDSFFVETVQTALYLDGLNSSHPISLPVRDPAQIGAIFDAISYQKGSSFIHMLADLAGPAHFQKGLQHYLAQHRFANAESSDLWAALGTQVPDLQGQSLPGFADAWTKHQGYPLLSVQWTANKTKLHITQQRFFFLRDIIVDEDQLWPVPITYFSSKSATKKKTWLRGKELELEGLKGARWVKLNAEQKGFYRVAYSDELLSGLATELRSSSSSLSETDRAGLLYDAFSLLKAGLVGAEAVLGLVGYAVAEEGRAPLRVLHSQLSRFHEFLRDTDELPAARAFHASLLRKAYAKHGWELPDEHRPRLRQLDLISAMCFLRSPDCLAEASRRFALWRADPLGVPIDLRPVTVAYGLAQGNRSDWEAVHRAYKASQNPSEANYLLMALSHSVEPELLSRLLRMSLDASEVKPGLSHQVVAAVAGNEVGRLLAWAFVREHWGEYHALLNGTMMLGHLVRGAVETAGTEWEVAQAEAWARGLPDLGLAAPALRQAQEGLRITLQWRHFNKHHVQHWLRRWADKTSS